MPEKPDWLPELFNCDGDARTLFDRLYAIFYLDFKVNKVYFNKRPVWYDQRITRGKEEGFWHLVTKDNKETGERFLDNRRAERLPWCGPTISNANDPIIKVWNYEESNKKIRTYIWLKDFDYLIVLERQSREKGDIYFLKTAFYIDGPGRKRRIMRKFEKSIF